MPSGKQPSTVFPATVIEFSGEQDGLPERELKERLGSVLRQGFVQRCYLARLRYDSSPEEVVALCVAVSDSPKVRENLLEDISSVFASTFGAGQSLDVLFVSAEQEKELARCCTPFFEGPIAGLLEP